MHQLWNWWLCYVPCKIYKTFVTFSNLLINTISCLCLNVVLENSTSVCSVQMLSNKLSLFYPHVHSTWIFCCHCAATEMNLFLDLHHWVLFHRFRDPINMVWYSSHLGFLKAEKDEPSSQMPSCYRSKHIWIVELEFLKHLYQQPNDLTMVPPTALTGFYPIKCVYHLRHLVKVSIYIQKPNPFPDQIFS